MCAVTIITWIKDLPTWLTVTLSLSAYAQITLSYVIQLRHPLSLRVWQYLVTLTKMIELAGAERRTWDFLTWVSINMLNHGNNPSVSIWLSKMFTIMYSWSVYHQMVSTFTFRLSGDKKSANVENQPERVFVACVLAEPSISEFQIFFFHEPHFHV